MARPNVLVPRYTQLQCVENEHPSARNITWIGMYVPQLDDEPIWKADVEGLICPHPDCASRLKAVQEYRETSPPGKP
jgi:hypothetical protein